MIKQPCIGLALLATTASLPLHAETVLKAGHVLSANSQFSVIVTTMNDEVSKRTNGKFRIENYPASALGPGPAMLEQTGAGTQDIIVSSTGGALSKFNPDAGILDLVGLIQSPEHADAVLDGPIGQKLLDSFAKYNIKGLAWGENGFRHLTTTSKPISGPKDMEGLTFRLSESDIYKDAFETLKTKVVFAPWAQVYQILKDGRADGEENPIVTILDGKLQEVQKYLTVSGHTYAAALVGMNLDAFNDLTPDEQKIFTEAAKKGALASRKFVRDQEKDGVAKLQAAGMQINTTFDRAAFTKALEPFYAKYAKIYSAELIEQVRSTAPK